MFSSTLSVALAALPMVLAQYGGGGSSSTMSSMPATSTTSSGTTVHAVTVGNGGLAFSPNSISAAVGDIVEFHFYPSKHSVAQSTFAAPCQPLANGSSFFSGGVPTTSGVNPNTFQLVINNTQPIWFYCAVPGHCEQGMAGVINQASSGSKTIEAYVAAAKNVNGTVAPATVQGGVVGPALAAGSSTSSSTSSGSSSTSTSKSAGIETRGSVRWMLVGFTGAAAVVVGSLMV